MSGATLQRSPLGTAALLVVAGVLLQGWHLRALQLPDRPQTADRSRGRARLARRARDRVVDLLPAILTGSLGRTLVVAGAGLVLVRLLDMSVEDDASLF